MIPAEESKSASPAETRLSDDIPTLEAEVAQLTRERDETLALIRQLRDSEDPANDVFHHQEIFEAQQKKLRLDVDIKFRTNKINRLNLGMTEDCVSDGVKGGFLF